MKQFDVKLMMWPTHWAGGINAVRVDGKNVPWLQVENGSMVAMMASNTTQENYEWGNEMARRWNAEPPLRETLKDAKENLESTCKGLRALGFKPAEVQALVDCIARVEAALK